MRDHAENVLRDLQQGRERIGVIHVWRGQADESWPLYPGLYRRLLSVHRKSNITERLIAEYEMDLLCEANGLGYYEGRLETLVQVQHYGGATRFLDVTRDPLIALWFATAAAGSGSDGAVFHFEIPADAFISDEDLSASLDVVTERAQEFGACLFFPRSEEKRIAAQRAGLIAATIDASLTDEGPFMGGRHGVRVDKIPVPSACKLLLRRHLGEAEGISARTLFPGMPGYAMDNMTSSPFLREYDRLHDGKAGIFPGRE